MMNEIKERPILFSCNMVQAILDGRKKQTRRVVKVPYGCIVQTGIVGQKMTAKPYLATGECSKELPCKWQVGDRLWVRETFAKICNSLDSYCDGEDCAHCKFEYRADNPGAKFPGEWPNTTPPIEGPPHWKPSIYMPRAASRITLEITAIRVERLQDISEADAAAEGIKMYRFGEAKMFSVADDAPSWVDPISAFSHLWVSLNGSESWESNPWVWVIEFKKIEPI